MKREFEPEVRTVKHNVYNLLYDKEKAKELYEKCTEEFSKDYETKWGKVGTAQKRYTKLLFELVVCALGALACCGLIFFFLGKGVILGIGVTTVVGIVLFGLAVYSGIYLKELSEDIAFKNMQYKNNEGPYEYPLLVCFHQAVGDNEIVGISIRNNHTDVARLLSVSFKTASGEQKQKKFHISKVVSCGVAQIEIDLENDVVRYPSKSKKSNFLINGKSEACE